MATPPQEESQKEYNFAQLRKQVEQERAERIRLAEENEQLKRMSSKPVDEEDDDSEPYVDRKKLNKFGQKLAEQNKQTTSEIVKNEVQRAIQETERKMWFKANPDFNKVMTPEILNKFEQQHEDLAQSILKIPDEFERQRIAYSNIKALRLDQPAVKEVPIQDKVDANRRSPYYQPSGQATAPYAQVGDFSDAGMKNSYDQMKALQKKLRL